ncbi:MAG: sugar phosphate isomerase/epimerase [Epulopiscium sp.]|nr:sugar phosphate isomerase/epimerase [Candidatus Epulonipiscium sp.]
MNLGVRAHDLNVLDDIEVIAQKVSEKGFTAIQLALAKALPSLNSSLGSLSPGMGRHIAHVLNRHNVDVAVLGCYINPVHPDLEQRRKSLDRFKEHIRFARDFNCSIIGTETGSINADFSFHPANHGEEIFHELVTSMKELVDEAEKFGVIVGVEAVTKFTINDPKRMKRLLDTIDSDNLQVIFDPVNLIDKNNYQRQEEVVAESLELFGDRIVIVHAKDFVLTDDGVKTVPVGQGLLNYDFILKEIKARKPLVNILLEDTKEPFMNESRDYLKKIYESV